MEGFISKYSAVEVKWEVKDKMGGFGVCAGNRCLVPKRALASKSRGTGLGGLG